MTAGTPTLVLITLASDVDGEAAFMEFIRSAGRALTQNQAMAPMVGLVILLALTVLADWKLAGWLERRWRRHHHHEHPRHAPRPHPGEHAPRR